ncbi:MAG: Hsp20/alpha crystallin family protein [Bryobacterales bacterium]|nr:Hsp20/alpha crystallin family protein [Bryobacterales bacterium]
MAIAKYDPFNASLFGPSSLQMLEDSLNRLFAEPSSSRPWSPAVDIRETENELILKADLPEMKLEDLDIQVENGTLTLKGERKFEKTDNDRGYHRIERSYGSFVRAFSLPEYADSEKVAADYKDGVLTITVPKKEVAKARAIKVNVKQ